MEPAFATKIDTEMERRSIQNGHETVRFLRKTTLYSEADSIARRKDPYEMGPKCHTKWEGIKKDTAMQEKDRYKNGRRPIRKGNDMGKSQTENRIARAKVHTKVERYGKGSGSRPHSIPSGTTAR